MDMVDERNENRLTMTVHRCYPVLLAALAFAISGCATTVGLGQAALREGGSAEIGSQFEPALPALCVRTDCLVMLGISCYAVGCGGGGPGQVRKSVNADRKAG